MIRRHIGVWADVKYETVKHSGGEYVYVRVTVNGVESYWALMTRGYHGVYHYWSVKQMERCIDEFEGQYNTRALDTIDTDAFDCYGNARKTVEVQRLDSVGVWSGNT